ncbi:MAG: hypothetical protein PHD51_00140 [Patescibacteria group bacterium]|nr:hypothetical protein [Patescibacteria group bacterium]MDD5490722.1 hypothetical protein [Patescibacteria group bacterium]
MNRGFVKIFFEELFYASFILWAALMILEFFIKGFVVNFFNPHFVLIISAASAIITLIIKEDF